MGKRGLAATGFIGVLFALKYIQLVHEKLTIFLYGLYNVGIYDSLVFQRYSQV